MYMVKGSGERFELVNRKSNSRLQVCLGLTLIFIEINMGEIVIHLNSIFSRLFDLYNSYPSCNLS